MLAPRDRTTQVLLEAADLIEQRGWCQNSAQGPGGSICAAQALALAAAYDFAFAAQVGRKLLHTVGFRTVPKWNDAPGRTQDEVVAALRQAAFMAG